MFSENFHTLRKAKGYSQEELAIRLNVVRQTISKWEKGISAPDADMLTRIADIFEVPVSELVGDKIELEVETNPIADQLSRVNEQLIISNRRSLRTWRTVAIACIAIIAIGFAGVSISIIDFYSNNNFASSVTAGVGTENALTVTVVNPDTFSTPEVSTDDASTATVIIHGSEPTPDIIAEITPFPDDGRIYDYDIIISDPHDPALNINMDNVVIAISDESGNFHLVEGYRDGAIHIVTGAD